MSILWTTAGLYLQWSLSSSWWAHEESSHDARMEVLPGLNDVDFHSLRLTWLKSLPSAQSVNRRDQHGVPKMTQIPAVISQLPGGRLIALGHFYDRKGSILFLLEETLGYRFAFPPGSAKLPSMDIQNDLSAVMIFYIALFLIKEITLQQKKHDNGLRLM